MTDIFRITQSKILALLLAFILLFVMVGLAYAQESPDEVAKKYNVTFPVKELGGCTDYASCRTYCEDPVNAESCISFAKEKGFYKEDDLQNKKDEILDKAKGALGCDSKTSCLNFCEVPANYDKCDAFAKSQGLVGGRVDDPSRTQVITKAKEVLGCDSETGCQSLCSKEENRQKCSEFAKTVGLHGGEQRVGPGGCTSEVTCKAFCSDPQNFQICSGFTEVAGGKFRGPGGCDSEESCRNYCQENEDECRAGFGGPGPGGSPPPGYNPQEMCNRTPNCSWTSNTCQCSGGSGQYSPAPGYSPQPGSTPPPGYTPPPSGTYYTPPTSGTYTPPSSSGSYTPPTSGSYQQPPSTGSYTPPSTTESAPPPSTTGSAPPPTSNNPPPPSTTESAPPPPTTESAPPPSGVQGVSTGLLQYLLDLLR